LRVLEHRVLSVNLALRLEVVGVGGGPVAIKGRSDVEASGIPYTIIRATQFLEFLGGIADSGTDGNLVRLPPVLFQPIAADDVAAVVATAFR
jgi:uncharacterized protein YbjT (DUF2867 family)